MNFIIDASASINVLVIWIQGGLPMLYSYDRNAQRKNVLDSLKDTVVLVSGAAGFIGSALCSGLKKEGAIVHGVSRCEQHSNHCSHWWKADLSDMAEVRRVVSSVKPDFIFHLASHARGDRAMALVQLTFQNNVVTTINLLTAATETGCKRIIVTGSLEEPDHDDKIPSSPYSASKLTASLYARMFH